MNESMNDGVVGRIRRNKPTNTSTPVIADRPVPEKENTSERTRRTRRQFRPTFNYESE